VPGVGGAIAKGVQQDPYWSPFFDGFKPVHNWLKTAKPDVAVVFYNDHGLNFFLDKMPTFAVGAADTYRNADEGWGLPVQNSFKGDTALSWHIIEGLVADEFDITTCQSMLVDHAVVVPCQLAALRSWQGDERIVVFGTGGLSQQLDGERAGFINQKYDRFCMDKLGPDVDALTTISALDVIEEAGSQGVEIVNWIAARGALGDTVHELSRNYHIPISNTAAATMLFATENEALEQAA